MSSCSPQVQRVDYRTWCHPTWRIVPSISGLPPTRVLLKCLECGNLNTVDKALIIQQNQFESHLLLPVSNVQFIGTSNNEPKAP